MQKIDWNEYESIRNKIKKIKFHQSIIINKIKHSNHINLKLFLYSILKMVRKDLKNLIRIQNFQLEINKLKSNVPSGIFYNNKKIDLDFFE